MKKSRTTWRWEGGLVDERKEHIELRYGNAAEMPYEQWEPIARIAKPQNHTFTIEWLVTNDTPEHKAILEDARQELDFYLVDKKEPNPWAYAIYHCNTGANMYSSVHWSYFATGTQGKRFASEVKKLRPKGSKKINRVSRESDEDKIKKAVFIRHKISTTPEILEDLWQRREIAIHFENIRSTNPDDYKDNAAKNALKRLHTYCNQGAVVGAVYRQIRPTQIMVGIIPKGSSVTFTDRYGDNYIYKTVQLQKAKEISLLDYPLLDAIQPRLASITGWTSAFDLLYRIVFDQPVPIDVNYLSPGQLEVLCSEYLRMKGLLKFLLLPIGRNLQDIDILGLGGDDNKIIAQVTHSRQLSKVDKKLHMLKQYNGQEAILIFFGPKSCKLSDSEVDYIDIESVFDELQSCKDGVYHHAIEMMLNK
jgi:hypothetical protein